MTIDPPTPSGFVLALVRDLLFASKITACAKATGVEARILRDPATLADVPGSLLLADLNQPGVIAAAQEWKQKYGGRVVGFVSHVDAQTIEAARQAGLDQILARSGFVLALPDLMREV
jgi:hypothetical protein